MGCNYYFVPKKTKQIKFTPFEQIFYCLDFNPLHIGKSSIGWTFTFQDTPYYHSYQELLSFYENNKDKIKIIDEYNRTIPITKFKKMVDIKSREVTNHTNYIMDSYSKTIPNLRLQCYSDEEGNSFSKNNFS